jgi:hypothetical protein
MSRKLCPHLNAAHVKTYDKGHNQRLRCWHLRSIETKAYATARQHSHERGTWQAMNNEWIASPENAMSGKRFVSQRVN